MKTSNYPNYIVPLKIAKKLREIGFRKKTCFYYSFEDSALFVVSKPENYNKKCYEEKYVTTSVWEQVLEWFRKKNLIGTIECEDFYPDDKTYYYAYCILNNLGKVLFYSPNYDTYETYEKAREALVNKLIEIYTNERK